MVLDKIREALSRRRSKPRFEQLKHCRDCTADCPYINGCC